MNVRHFHPYKNVSFNTVYNLLFCDDPELFRPKEEPKEYPWNILFSLPVEKEKLISIAKDVSLESRLRLLAFLILKKSGNPSPDKVLLGVIIEIGLDQGLDTLAAFNDGTARYINQAEKLIVWDTNTTESTSIISELFTVSQHVVNKIGPWDDDRRPAPAKGICRMTFLVSGEIYFGEGPFEILEQDPLGGAVIQAATKLLLFLTNKSSQH